MSLTGSFTGVQYQVPSPSGSLMVWLRVEPHQLDSTKGHRSVGWTKPIAELDLTSLAAQELRPWSAPGPERRFFRDILQLGAYGKALDLSDHVIS